MMDGPDVFVGLDVHKRSIVVALAETERGGEVRRYGEIDNDPLAIGKLVRKLEKCHRRPAFVY